MQVLSTAAAQFSKTLCNLLRENIVESQSASAAKKTNSVTPYEPNTGLCNFSNTIYHRNDDTRSKKG